MRSASLLLLSLLAASAQAQNHCPDGGFGGDVGSFDLDPVTGTDSHLGLEFLGGEYFVSARGAGAIPPHRIHVFDAGGSLLRSFDQPAATATSPWGLRDLASDGLSVFGGDETGVHGFDAQGNPVQQVRARNGLRPIGTLQNSPADQVLGTFRALAFDPDGNGGEGSFWSANFDSDLVEFDLVGTVIRRYSNTIGWSIYGLAHDPCSGSIWAWSDPAEGGQVFEISTSAGGPTGRSFPAPGVQGGLAIHPATDGRRTLIARLDQSGPDRVRIGVLHRAPGICDALVLRSAIANRRHGHSAWAFVRDHWDESNEKFPSNAIVRMVESVKFLNTPDLVADAGAFFAEHPIEQATKTLEQILELQRVNAALRERDGAALATFLDASV